jgi:hypothetical protein
MLQTLIVLGIYGLTLFCAYNIGRLQAQTKVLKFIKQELSGVETVNGWQPPNLLTFINKLISTL